MDPTVIAQLASPATPLDTCITLLDTAGRSPVHVVIDIADIPVPVKVIWGNQVVTGPSADACMRALSQAVALTAVPIKSVAVGQLDSPSL